MEYRNEPCEKLEKSTFYQRKQYSQYSDSWKEKWSQMQ